MKSVLKKILLIGNSPLPNENEQVRPAAGLRTWQFLSGLGMIGRDGGSDGRNGFDERSKFDGRSGFDWRSEFEVRLVTIAMPECYKGEIVEGEVVIHKDNPGLKKILQEIHDEFQPEVIIAVNTYPSYVACGLQSHAPLWADLNGWIMAEAQAQAYKMDSNDYLGHYLEMERAVVARADKFSAVSQAEGLALLGELAGCGRLNKESFGYKFVEHVPNGIEWFEGEMEVWEKGGGGFGAIGKIPKDAFVLLWLGGYNTWVDEFTLFKAVNEAMQKCPNLYFVSTGGEIDGLDNSTFAKFKKMIEGSEYKERFIFLGWVETAEIPLLYARAQAGINVDRRCVETMTGARNRINEMMKFGLPVLTTKGSEIADDVARAGAGVTVKSGDHAALSAAIEELYSEWRGGGGRETVKFKEYGKKGREYIETHCNYGETLKPLLAWLENPRPAPDRGVRAGGFGSGGGSVRGWFGRRGGGGRFDGGLFGKLRGLPGLKTMWRYLRENGFKKSFKKFLQRMSG